jgi:hypothetical protein
MSSLLLDSPRPLDSFIDHLLHSLFLSLDPSSPLFSFRPLSLTPRCLRSSRDHCAPPFIAHTQLYAGRRMTRTRRCDAHQYTHTCTHACCRCRLTLNLGGKESRPVDRASFTFQAIHRMIPFHYSLVRVPPLVRLSVGCGAIVTGPRDWQCYNGHCHCGSATVRSRSRSAPARISPSPTPASIATKVSTIHAWPRKLKYACNVSIRAQQHMHRWAVGTRSTPARLANDCTLIRNRQIATSSISLHLPAP